MQRVLVSVAPGVECARVVEELRALGARAQEPAPELPGVVIAEVSRTRVEVFLREAACIPGVVVAELDVMLSTEPEPEAEREAKPAPAPAGEPEPDRAKREELVEPEPEKPPRPRSQPRRPRIAPPPPLPPGWVETM